MKISKPLLTVSVRFYAHPCLILFLSLSLLSSASLFAAEPPPTPLSLRGGEVITAKQAKQIFDHADALFIDTRSPINYGRGHVPGAMLVPYGQKSIHTEDFDASMDTYDVSVLPANKDVQMVIYSHGDTGWKSYKMAVIAIRHGYSRVMWMREGFSQWQANSYPAE